MKIEVVKNFHPAILSKKCRNVKVIHHFCFLSYGTLLNDIIHFIIMAMKVQTTCKLEGNFILNYNFDIKHSMKYLFFSKLGSSSHSVLYDIII